MDKTQVNPWSWQDSQGFSQCWSVAGAERVLFISGQAPISPGGQLVGDRDFEAQVAQVFENLQTVLEHAGGRLDSVVKLTVYLTDIGRLRDFGRIKARFIDGPQPASTAVGVTGLALPGMMVEVEALAVV
jgi:reactive intermediate/imine deaminase